jgi:phosphatidylinositol alpha-1,6-mannosyltransferase
VGVRAAATGLPVLVGRSGGSPASVLPGENGLVIGATTPAPVADAVAALLRDPDRARRMGAAGRAWMENHWSWERATARLAALLGETPDLPESPEPAR